MKEPWRRLSHYNFLGVVAAADYVYSRGDSDFVSPVVENT